MPTYLGELQQSIQELLGQIAEAQSVTREEKPAFSPRELALVKTKVEEAKLWLSQVQEL